MKSLPGEACTKVHKRFSARVNILHLFSRSTTNEKSLRPGNWKVLRLKFRKIISNAHRPRVEDTKEN